MGVLIIDGLLTLLELLFAAIGWLTGDRRRRGGSPASRLPRSACHLTCVAADEHIMEAASPLWL